MVYRHCIKTIAYILLLILPLTVTNVSGAADISLPKFSKDVRLAGFHSTLSANVSPLEAIDDDPITEVLAMYEVDVWDRIRRGFSIPDLQNPLVTQHENYYLRHLPYFDRTTVRATRYLFHIVQELEKRNMPTELALLPFIESAFNPHARSSARAEGMWQFIPSTGLHYDLAQSVFRDDRRCILQSTEAALTYLQNLYNMFGDWHLALAAYNWGEGSVGRAVRKNRESRQGIDFNSLSVRMPAETRNYVPKLQAVKNLIASPEQYAISLPKIENQPYFVKIGKTRDIDVSVAAKLAEISVDDFRALNSQFGQFVITGGSDVYLLLPKRNAQKFKENIENWKQPLSSWTAYQVTQTRETVESIAEKYKTTPEVIRHANHIPSHMVLKAGSTVLVPRPASYAHRPEKDISPEMAASGRIAMERIGMPTRVVRVTVKPQDTLFSIARRYKCDVADLRSWNKLNSDRIHPGSVLVVHVPQAAQPKNRAAPKKRTAGRSSAAQKQKSPRTAAKKPAGKPSVVASEPKPETSKQKDV